MDTRILIIIPAYNEEDNILKTYRSIIDYNEKHHTTYDVLVINDGSTDSTGKICKEHKIPCIHLVHNLGIGGAVQTGYKYAYMHDYDIAIQYDGDGQHDVRYVEKLCTPIINKDAEFVIGSRFVDKTLDTFKTSFLRRQGIKLISFAIKIVGKQKIFDTTSGFRACNKEIIKIFARYYPIEYPEPITNVEILKMGFKVKEVPAEMNEREAGASSIHTWKNIYYMVNILLSIFLVSLRRYKR